MHPTRTLRILNTVAVSRWRSPVFLLPFASFLPKHGENKGTCPHNALPKATAQKWVFCSFGPLQAARAEKVGTPNPVGPGNNAFFQSCATVREKRKLGIGAGGPLQRGSGNVISDRGGGFAGHA
jgi:hypothetical protein